MVTTWKCRVCGDEGVEFPPEECPHCEAGYYDIEATEAGVRMHIRGHETLNRRMESVAEILDCGRRNTYEVGSTEIQVTWEARACSRGCCGWETHHKSFPLRYLWMSESAIRAEEKANEDAKAAAEAEAERASELREAEAALERARARAGSAATAAAGDLGGGEAAVASLRSQP